MTAPNATPQQATVAIAVESSAVARSGTAAWMRGRRVVRQRPGDPQADGREQARRDEERGETAQPDELLAERRRERVRGEGRDAEEAEGGRPAPLGRELRRQRRGRVEAGREGEPLQRAQREDRRPDAVDEEEGARRGRHAGDPAEQEDAPPEAVEERAHGEHTHQAREAARPHHEPDRPLRAPERAHVQRQEEERGEGQEEAEVRRGHTREAGRAGGGRHGPIGAPQLAAASRALYRPRMATERRRELRRRRKRRRERLKERRHQRAKERRRQPRAKT